MTIILQFGYRIEFFVSPYLTEAGIIGPITWRKLYEIYWGIRDGIGLPSVPPAPPPETGVPPYPGQPIRIGERGENVARIQRCLNQAINAGLNPDGIFGPLTSGVR